MNRKERLAHLIKAIKMEAVNVDNLSEQFGVSASTIRRDLQFLQQHEEYTPNLSPVCENLKQ